MSRSINDAGNSSSELQDCRVLASRREHDQAMKFRLEQLETAQGSHSVHTPVAPNSPSVHHAAMTKLRSFSSGTLLLTAFVSAIGGAGVMWFMMGFAKYDSQHQQAIHPVPVVVGDTLVSTAPVLSVGTVVPIPVRTPSKGDESESQVRDLVEGWRQAWQRRDVEAYLRYYGPQFVPSNGQTRSDWNKARQQNLSSRSEIRLGVKEIRIEHIGENSIKFFFLQDYASGAYQERSQPKTLLIERNDKQWQIAGEFQDKK